MKKIFSILLFSLSFHLVQAQSFANYPEKNITIIVGFPPGTATDTIARILAERFSNKLGKSFIIENKPGQGGSLGAGIAAQAIPDGHTLLLSATAPFATNPHLYAKLNYDSRKSFAPIGLVSWLPYVMVTNPKSGLNSMQDLIEKSKIEPRPIFVDVYTDWCGWCKKMDRDTFQNPKVVAYMNKQYYCILFG